MRMSRLEVGGRQGGAGEGPRRIAPGQPEREHRVRRRRLLVCEREAQLILRQLRTILRLILRTPDAHRKHTNKVVRSDFFQGRPLSLQTSQSSPDRLC